jgi:hypothetical protein
LPAPPRPSMIFSALDMAALSDGARSQALLPHRGRRPKCDQLLLPLPFI